MKRCELTSGGVVELTPSNGLRVWNGNRELIVQVQMPPHELRGLAKRALVAADELETLSKQGQ